MKKIPVLFSLFLLITALFQSCEVENCPPNALSFAHFTLVDQYGRQLVTSVPTSIYGAIKTDVTIKKELPDGSIVEEIVRDSVIKDTLINKEQNLKSFKVPLSYDDETMYIIDYDGKQQDYITVKHRNIPYFLNIDCGTMMFHEVTEVSASQGIDSIKIINPNIDNYEKENFKIYFTVADNQ